MAGVPLEIACGTADLFHPADRTFAPSAPVLAGTDVSADGHTDSFWRHSAPCAAAVHVVGVRLSLDPPTRMGIAGTS